MIELELHSPLTSVNAFFGAEQFGVNIWLKRDDMIHPYISGNKWRKLKYWLIYAKENSIKTLTTFGGAWSNHLLATACAGATFGFETVGFVRGDEGVLNPVLSLCKLYGMRLEFVSRQDYHEKQNVYTNWLERTKTPAESCLCIDEGGYGQWAVNGCAELIPELLNQLPRVDHLFCACGTGATLAGLSKGIAQCEEAANLQLQAVPVLKNAAYLHDQILQLHAESVYHWHDDYHFGGYAKYNTALTSFVKDFCSKTGILIEPIYTGKVCYAVADLLQKGYFDVGCNIVILHTGGLTGLIGQHDKF